MQAPPYFLLPYPSPPDSETARDGQEAQKGPVNIPLPFSGPLKSISVLTPAAFDLLSENVHIPWVTPTIVYFIQNPTNKYTILCHSLLRDGSTTKALLFTRSLFITGQSPTLNPIN